MRVRMKTHITGYRNEEPWPPIGGEIEVPDHEAADLIAAGYAEEARRHAAPGDADGGAPPDAHSDSGDGLDALGVRDLRDRVAARLDTGELVVPSTVKVAKLKKDELLDLLRAPGDADGGAPPDAHSDSAR